MTRLLPLLLLTACGLTACGLTACGDAPDDPAGPPPDGAEVGEVAADVFGRAVPSGEALSPSELISGAGDYAGRTVLVEGAVREVCQMAGCWMSFADDQGRTVRIEVPRDDSGSYLFTFPTDASGRTVRVHGMLAVETESVEDLRHYAEDGGASAAEIAAITEPERTLVLTALGAQFAADDAPDSAVAPA